MDTVDLYTCIKSIDADNYEVFKRIGGQEVPGSRGTFSKEASPYIALRMNRVDGESYGRGYAEQYYGDLKSLEALNGGCRRFGGFCQGVVLGQPERNHPERERYRRPRMEPIREGSAADVSTATKLESKPIFALRTRQSTRSMSGLRTRSFLLKRPSVVLNASLQKRSD